MIPTVPVTPPATHVEHFSPIVYLRQMKLRRLLRVPFPFESARMTTSPRNNDNRVVNQQQDLARLLASYPFMPINVARPPYARLGGVAEYYRGNDLRYAPNVSVPPAGSVDRHGAAEGNQQPRQLNDEQRQQLEVVQQHRVGPERRQQQQRVGLRERQQHVEQQPQHQEPKLGQTRAQQRQQKPNLKKQKQQHQQQDSSSSSSEKQ